MSISSSETTSKVLIVAIMAVALAMAGFSWWFRYQSTHQAVEFWGAEAAATIRDAERVAAHLLGPVSTTGEELFQINGQGYQSIVKIDISRAPGVTHLRNALLEDRNIGWEVSMPNGPQSWRYLLLFRDDQDHVQMIAFDRDASWLTHPTSDGNWRIASSGPIASGITQVLKEWFDAEELTASGAR